MSVCQSVCLSVCLTVCQSFKIVLLGHTLAKIKVVQNDVCRLNDIYHRMVKLRNLHFVTLIYFLEVKICFILISLKWNRLHKNMWETFVDFDNCHRMVYVRKLHSVTLTYFLEVNSLKFLHL